MNLMSRCAIYCSTHITSNDIGRWLGDCNGKRGGGILKLASKDSRVDSNSWQKMCQKICDFHCKKLNSMLPTVINLQGAGWMFCWKCHCYGVWWICSRFCVCCHILFSRIKTQTLGSVICYYLQKFSKICTDIFYPYHLVISVRNYSSCKFHLICVRTQSFHVTNWSLLSKMIFIQLPHICI